MANWISHDENLRKHEKKGKLDLRTQKLFGVIKGFRRRIDRSKPATVFSGYQTVKMFEDCQRELELQEAKAIMHISRLQTRLI